MDYDIRIPYNEYINGQIESAGVVNRTLVFSVYRKNFVGVFVIRDHLEIILSHIKITFLCVQTINNLVSVSIK